MGIFNRIIVENNEIELINKFIIEFKKILKRNVKKKKRFSFVLTGGNSPIKLYKSLAKTKLINWKKIDFFMSDERYVDKISKNSNIYMCKKNLLNKLNIDKKQIFEIEIKGNSILDDCRNYEKKINNYFKKKKFSFDFVLLGLGTDGHIASLFKENIKNKKSVKVNFVYKKNFSRITLTLNSLNCSKNIFLWVPGIKKSKIIKNIFFNKKKKYPILSLKPKTKLTLFLDKFSSKYLFNSNRFC